MTTNKKTLTILSSMAHMICALILADLVPSILTRILLIVTFGVIGGLQIVCLENGASSKDSSTGNNQQVNTESAESQAGSAYTASIPENKEHTD